MPLRRFALLGLALAVPASRAQTAPPLSAAAIMARVAANQDRADIDRTRYLYIQHARVASRRGSNTMCEETTDSRITPFANGSLATLLKLNGRRRQHGQYVTYTALPATRPSSKANAATPPDSAGSGNPPADPGHATLSIDLDGDLDCDLVEDMRSGLTNDTSKDGLAAGLFPLTSARQAGYRFRLVGQEHLNGRDVFHLAFQPDDKNNFSWKGDAFIDTAAFQPVVVRTTASRKLPFAVHTLLGTSLPGLGFTVVYAPQPDGVWFPVSFGTEFKLNVLFFFHRQIVIDATNQNFERTHVTSTLLGGAAPVSPVNPLSGTPPPPTASAKPAPPPR